MNCRRSSFAWQMATRVPAVAGRPMYHKLARTRWLMKKLKGLA